MFLCQQNSELGRWRAALHFDSSSENEELNYYYFCCYFVRKMREKIVKLRNVADRWTVFHMLSWLFFVVYVLDFVAFVPAMFLVSVVFYPFKFPFLHPNVDKKKKFFYKYFKINTKDKNKFPWLFGIIKYRSGVTSTGAVQLYRRWKDSLCCSWNNDGYIFLINRKSGLIVLLIHLVVSNMTRYCCTALVHSFFLFNFN